MWFIHKGLVLFSFLLHTGKLIRSIALTELRSFFRAPVSLSREMVVNSFLPKFKLLVPQVYTIDRSSCMKIILRQKKTNIKICEIMLVLNWC